MTSRLDALVTAWSEAYAGETPWLVGAEHIHNHAYANRIVVYPTDGPIMQPAFGAQGMRPAERTIGQDGAIDDLLWTRRPNLEVAIWGTSQRQAEHRLHGVLVALSHALGESDVEVSGLRESWIRSGDVSSGGVLVVLSVEVCFDVFASDAALLEDEIATGDPGAFGAGGPTTVVTEVTVTYLQDDETIAVSTFESDET